MQENTCCFFGHRTINETEELKTKLYEVVEKLIIENKVDTFLFGSKSRFNDLCLDIVTKIKEEYPDIKRVYIRAEYKDIDDEYKNYLLRFYDDTYFPEKIAEAGKAVYIERNFEMIDKSSFCVIYYEIQNVPSDRKSGTRIALDYAVKKQKDIIVLPKEITNV